MTTKRNELKRFQAISSRRSSLAGKKHSPSEISAKIRIVGKIMAKSETDIHRKVGIKAIRFSEK